MLFRELKASIYFLGDNYGGVSYDNYVEGNSRSRKLGEVYKT